MSRDVQSLRINAPGKWWDGLTHEEKEFVKKYCANGRNGARAAVRPVGDTINAASLRAGRLLERDHILIAIDALLEETFGIAKVTPERIIEELAALAFARLSDCYDESGKLLPIHEIPERTRRALSEVNVEAVVKPGTKGSAAVVTSIKLKDKVKALKLLGQFYKMFGDRVIVEGGDKPIQVQTGKLDTLDLSDRIDSILGVEGAGEKALAPPKEPEPEREVGLFD